MNSGLQLYRKWSKLRFSKLILIYALLFSFTQNLRHVTLHHAHVAHNSSEFRALEDDAKTFFASFEEGCAICRSFSNLSPANKPQSLVEGFLRPALGVGHSPLALQHDFSSILIRLPFSQAPPSFA